MTHMLFFGLKKIRKHGWEGLWEKLEQEGNVGLDYVINPVLYPEIIRFLAMRPKSTVVDFGCGTNILGIQLLFGYRQSIPALRRAELSDELDRARFNVLLYLGIEETKQLVRRSNEYLNDIGNPSSIAIIRKRVGNDTDGVFDSETVDLCVSRNFLMHLSVGDFQEHVSQAASMLKPDGAYIFATLNPDYEIAKVGRRMENGEAYGFAHGKSGEYGVFAQFYKETSFMEEIFSEFFVIEKKISCVPIVEAYRESHSRYYDPDVPMAFVYALRKR